MRWSASPRRRQLRDAVSRRRDAVTRRWNGAGAHIAMLEKLLMLGQLSEKAVQLAQVAMSGETLGAMLEEVGMREEIGVREEIALLKKDLSLTLYRVKFFIVWMLCREKEGGREGGREGRKESLYTFLLVRFKNPTKYL
jgi:hypothetical protein